MNKKLFISLIIIAVSVNFKTATAQSSNIIVCYDNNADIVLVEAKCDNGDIPTYKWEQSPDGNTWSPAEGENDQKDYKTPKLTSSMHYQRIACGKDIITILVDVLPKFDPGAINSGTSTFYGNQPISQPILSLQKAEGGDGKISYRWRRSNNPTPLANSIGENYTVTGTLPTGTYIFTREAKDGGECTDDWVPSQGSWTLIVEAERPKLEFKNPNTSVCSNHEIDYTVTEYSNTTYDWTTNDYGTIIRQEKNKVTVKWNVPKSIIASIGKITVSATDTITKISEKDSLSVAVSSEIVPNAEQIVAKKDTLGIWYILIYPVPGYNYEWYKGSQPIPNAKEQFYYPGEEGLTVGMEYKVKVWENNENCACFQRITIPPNIVSSSKVFNIFPNPVSNGNFTVSFNREALQDNAVNYVLGIYSLLGVKVWEQNVYTLDNIIVNKTMPTGFYFMTLTTGKQHYTEKFTVK